MNANSIEALFQALNTAHPNPQSDLRYGNHFELLVAVILSAQATDQSVNRVTPALFARAPTPQAMLELGEEGIRPFIQSIGLFNGKAKNLASCCRSLVEQHQGQVPNTRKELEALAGVGAKTAGVVLNIAFGEPTIPVDTHVFRLSNRLGLVKTKNPQSTEPSLLKVVPKWARPKAHHLLILHGRYICKARKPLCDDCCIQTYCQFYADLPQ